MSNKFELSIPVSPDVVKQRLEAARKEMAPKVGTCVMSTDKSFQCRLDYANAFALVKAEPTSNGAESKVVVEIHGFTIWTTPRGMKIAIAIPLIGVIIVAISGHLKTSSDWSFIVDQHSVGLVYLFYWCPYRRTF